MLWEMNNWLETYVKESANRPRPGNRRCRATLTPASLWHTFEVAWASGEDCNFGGPAG